MEIALSWTQFVSSCPHAAQMRLLPFDAPQPVSPPEDRLPARAGNGAPIGSTTLAQHLSQEGAALDFT